MSYACLRTQTFSDPPYLLTPLRHQDIFDIMKWRNEQMSILRQTVVLTKDLQEHYYKTTILHSFIEKHPKQVLFSFLLKDKCIGYGGLVHIDWPSRRAEVSFLVETKRANDRLQYHTDFTAYLNLIKKVAFQELHFHRLFTETFDIRPQHISILEKQGFTYEGRLKEHTLINEKFVDSLMHGLVNHE